MRFTSGRLVPSSIVAALVASVLAFGGGAAATASCAEASHPGGDWPSYGHDLANSRHQQQETTISTANAINLHVDWAFSANSAGGGGLLGFSSTPVIAGGCMYVASGGTIFALNADTGELVWKTQLQKADLGGMPGSTYAVSVVDGRVHVNIGTSQREGDVTSAPVGVALDAATGQLLWVSEPIEFGHQTGATASAVVYDGMQLLPTSGPDGDNHARPGIGVLDAGTGAVLAKSTTIPEEDLARGYSGGGIWTTAPVDTETGFAYAGTANPYANCCEHEYDNALVKIDMRKGSPTLGKVVDAYKGNVDQYFPGLNHQPVCDEYPDLITYVILDYSVTCAQLDIDFGASPVLFENSRGHKIVGAIQKSGVFHAAFADTMQQAWTVLVATPPPGTAGNADSAAWDGRAIYVVSNPGVLRALDPDTGRTRWYGPVVDGFEYHPPAVANGVVYVIGNHGLLLGFDAAMGLPVLARSLVADTGDACATLGGGIAVARNKIYAVCDTGATGGGWVVAYSL